MKRKPKERTTMKYLELLNRYYARTGLYRFAFKSFLKLVMVVGAFVGLFFIVEPYLLEYQPMFKHYISSVLPPPLVFALFYVSESILGLIPPDLFMVWARAKFPDIAYLLVTALATISYLGGMTAYFLGVVIRKNPRINNYFTQRYGKSIATVRKWGGIFVVVAALLPLPFATISTVAGMVQYPFRLYLLFGLTRYLRFYGYAVVLFRAFD